MRKHLYIAVGNHDEVEGLLCKSDPGRETFASAPLRALSLHLPPPLAVVVGGLKLAQQRVQGVAPTTASSRESKRRVHTISFTAFALPSSSSSLLSLSCFLLRSLRSADLLEPICLPFEVYGLGFRSAVGFRVQGLGVASAALLQYVCICMYIYVTP
jgi:hypothetical protein